MSAPISIRDAAADVLHRLTLRGVRLDADDAGGLTFDAPADVLTPGDLAELRRLKQHCLHILETAAMFDFDPQPAVEHRAPAHPPDPAADARPLLYRLAGQRGYPRTVLPNRPCETIAGGADGWLLFCDNGNAPDVLAVAEALKAEGGDDEQ